MAKKQTNPKTISITLRANGEALMLVATAKPDGTAVTTVTHRNAEKKNTRGMTKTHKTMDAAKTHLDALAADAQKQGWERKRFGDFTPKPDVFASLPAAPKAGA